MTEEVLHNVERMLTFRPNAGLQVLQLFRHAAEFIVGQRLAFGRHHCDVPGHVFCTILFALFDALIACVAHRRDLSTMHQRVLG